jgi:CBS domain-containing protein
MVKSYKGVEIPKEGEIIHKSITVADYMATSLITFREHQSIYEVMDTLLKHRISGGPVVNDLNELVGVISEGDCLKEVVKGRYHGLPILTGKVEEYMAQDVHHIHPETSIFEAASKFLSMRFRRFPVVKEGKLIGQISQRDIMKAVRSL